MATVLLPCYAQPSSQHRRVCQQVQQSSVSRLAEAQSPVRMRTSRLSVRSSKVTKFQSVTGPCSRTSPPARALRTNHSSPRALTSLPWRYQLPGRGHRPAAPQWAPSPGPKRCQRVSPRMGRPSLPRSNRFVPRRRQSRSAAPRQPVRPAARPWSAMYWPAPRPLRPSCVSPRRHSPNRQACKLPARSLSSLGANGLARPTRRQRMPFMP
mmetsp:Transcript_14820/g.41479  ORF Transcript_14820/g.41479 Transcript_14820/m.41479 type:complete len:210 (+) Transcript_14820:601-1230(+)